MVQDLDFPHWASDSYIFGEYFKFQCSLCRARKIVWLVLESYNNKNKLSNVQMSVNSYISITYNNKNKLGNKETSELQVWHSPKKK